MRIVAAQALENDAKACRGHFQALGNDAKACCGYFQALENDAKAYCGHFQVLENDVKACCGHSQALENDAKAYCGHFQALDRFANVRWRVEERLRSFPKKIKLNIYEIINCFVTTRWNTAKHGVQPFIQIMRVIKRFFNRVISER